jgi:chemotaxis signal transduction protein
VAQRLHENATITAEERERMLVLCQQIAVEKDHSKFGFLVRELNDLLEHKEKRIEPHPRHADNPSLRVKSGRTVALSSSGRELDSSVDELES